MDEGNSPPIDERPRPAGIGHNVPDFTQHVSDRIEHLAPSELKPAKRRTRKHTKEQIAKIAAALSAFGVIVPIVIDESNIIISGHAVWEAAKTLGLDVVPAVRVTHLSDDEKRALALSLNRLAELSEWDEDALKLELGELIEIDFAFDLDVTGFSIGEIDAMLGSDEEVVDPADEVPEPDGPATTRLGDIFRLGRHRLLCGDALATASYEALMQGARARIVLSDPPYNVKLQGFAGGLGKHKRREFLMASGEMLEPEFIEFLAIMILNCLGFTMKGGLLYLFMDWRHDFELITAARRNGLEQINLCIWDKTTGGMGSLYRSQHELCFVFKADREPHINNVELGKHGRYRTNVWRQPGMSSFGKGRDEALSWHVSVKPVALLAEAIKDSTNPGDIVLDPFLGSGSTLIAAQRAKRVCFGMEIDPIYCDTIIRRFEKITRQQAIHEETGLTFGELAKLRAAEPVETAAADVERNADGAPAPKPSSEPVAQDNIAPLQLRHRSRPAASKGS